MEIQIRTDPTPQSPAGLPLGYASIVVAMAGMFVALGCRIAAAPGNGTIPTLVKVGFVLLILCEVAALALGGAAIFRSRQPGGAQQVIPGVIGICIAGGLLALALMLAAAPYLIELDRANVQPPPKSVKPGDSTPRKSR